jgi:NAD(P)H-hydrate repair Nnr-like enzyme with NAD(P)H-hydrate dehydratase domain
MSIGEDRVRVKFNPSDNSVVSQIKQKSAELIDLVQSMPTPKDEAKKGEFARLCALANTHYEDAAMWAVKAATI